MDNEIGNDDSAPLRKRPRREGARGLHPLWFIRKDGQVTGPHPHRVVSSFLIIGRLDPDHEISTDGKIWERIREHPELIPEGLLNQDPALQPELLRKRLNEDERVGGRRQRNGVRKQDGEMRHSERRAPETVSWRVARKLRLEQLRKTRRQGEPTLRGIRWTLIMAPVLALGALFLAALDQGQLDGWPLPDCQAAPAPGINWNHCDFSGMNFDSVHLDGATLRNANLQGTSLRSARLRNADFSYANLRSARLDRSRFDDAILRGANLSGASLMGANLAGADLRYADLRDARLAGASLASARLDRALWTNGQRCGDESLGYCR